MALMMSRKKSVSAEPFMLEHDIGHDMTGLVSGTTTLTRSGASSATSQSLVVSKGEYNTLTLSGYNSTSFKAKGVKADGTTETITISGDALDLTNYIGAIISFFASGSTFTATLS